MKVKTDLENGKRNSRRGTGMFDIYEAHSKATYKPPRILGGWNNHAIARESGSMFLISTLSRQVEARRNRTTNTSKSTNKVLFAMVMHWENNWERFIPTSTPSSAY